MLRSCYRVPVRFYSHSPAECEVFWYFTEPGVEPLPFPTRFNSKNWRPARDGASPMGEVYEARRVWVNGIGPGLVPPGAVPCGTPEQFLQGQPFPPLIPPPQLTGGGLRCCRGRGLIGGGAGGGGPLQTVGEYTLDGGGGAGGGEPYTVDFPAGAIVWLEPTGLDHVGDGDPIDYWPDRSAAARNFAVATAFVPDASLDPNGGSFLVSFWGLGESLTRQGSLVNVDDCTAFLVVYFDESVPWDVGVQVGRGGTTTPGVLIGYDDVEMVAAKGAVVRTESLADVGTGWHVLAIRRTGADWEFFEDGVPLGTETVFAGTVGLDRMFGGITGGGGTAGGFVAECLLWSSALPDGALDFVNLYLRTKYGTP